MGSPGPENLHTLSSEHSRFYPTALKLGPVGVGKGRHVKPLYMILRNSGQLWRAWPYSVLMSMLCRSDWALERSTGVSAEPTQLIGGLGCGTALT